MIDADPEDLLFAEAYERSTWGRWVFDSSADPEADGRRAVADRRRAEMLASARTTPPLPQTPELEQP